MFCIALSPIFLQLLFLGLISSNLLYDHTFWKTNLALEEYELKDGVIGLAVSLSFLCYSKSSRFMLRSDSKIVFLLAGKITE